MIIAFTGSGTHTDATHAALILAHALSAAGEPVIVIRSAELSPLSVTELEGSGLEVAEGATLVDLSATVSGAQAPARHIVLDLASADFRSPAIRCGIDVRVITVGPYALDESAAAALGADDAHLVPAAPAWYLGCRRSGGGPAAASFAAAMARCGQTTRVLPVVQGALSRSEATALTTRHPRSRALRTGHHLLAVLRKVAADPFATSVSGPATDALSETERVSACVDERSFPERLRELADDLDAIEAGHGPTPADLAGAPILDNWNSEITVVPCLTGSVSEHPNIPMGRPVRTSQVIMTDNATWARTLSRFYALRIPAAAGGPGRLQ
ncbi:DUF6634 family protein [Methylobacterium soli]|uniref:Uncharacterized protein n=1 Tax=Methylobacterium soli TaxID=553447 RepID=A0A6L3SVZ3_9HYPH|nr:DUF6634 family protein [Methylobacterium soli]KAB1076754.1 hypothetical protein F6X53_21950 [Methylobacterium soli]GJE43380.1 hypothetical protein AEGHOMDF_2559 [Methylobacterium soli]